MTTDKPQQQSLQQREGADFVSQSVFDKEYRLLAFKDKMALSTKDYVILFFLSLIILVFLVVVACIQPMGLFHVVSKEQAEAMFQENLHKTLLENLKDIFLMGFFSSEMSMTELYRAAGWNGVWAYILMMPQFILGALLALFPVVVVVRLMVKRELKGMVQQLEQQLGKSSQ
ncbi:hypothetical protein [Bartonella harrusi]|uniref:DUF2798 domain-containing protein n=1 Tax=Bartonella harrusi TaxID=2961895 RepID=A0ABY5EUW4_9HYPH|nr:hypothetical protein [Bartonella harrusi]UTO28188.1 hypothetical protein NMK50_08440 [Bartonella harrusi]